MLIESTLERDVKFGGVIRDLQVEAIDPTSRTDLMRAIDRGKRDKRIAWSTNPELRAMVYLNVHHIKFSAKADKEDVLLRIPLHQVAAVSYINDDGLHLLAIVFGELDVQQRARTVERNLQYCHLAVVYCDSRGLAEELCTAVEQCFQTAYTEATMHFFDFNLTEGAGAHARASGFDYTYSGNKSVVPKAALRNHSAATKLGFLSHSSISLGGNNNGSDTSFASVTSRTRSRSPPCPGQLPGPGQPAGPRSRSGSVPRQRSGTLSLAGEKEESELSDAANQLILDYMRKLYTKLSTEELQRFALLVKAWHADMSFHDFCNGVCELYGPERTHLLIGMRPFIPAKDSAYFEHFIELTTSQTGRSQSSINEPLTSGTSQSRQLSSNAAIRYKSQDLSMERRHDDEDDSYDVMLDDISRGIDQLGADIDSN